jgi:hypothetical protein
MLLAVGLLGLAGVFGLFEPVSASPQRVTSDDVQLVSERTSSHDTPQSRYRNGMNVRNRHIR